MPYSTVVTAAWVAGLVITASLIIVIALRRKRGERFARRLGLALPDDPTLRDEVLRRDRRRIVWGAIGACIGGIAAVSAVLAATAADMIPDPEMGVMWIGLAGVVLGGSIAALCVVLGAPRSVDPTRPRVAHARRTELDDYLDPIELVGARVVAVLGAAVTALALAVPTSNWMVGGQPLASTVLAVGGLVTLVLLEVGGRRVVLARPRIAETPSALAWDDARRASELRILATAPIMMGSYAFMFASYAVISPALRLLPDLAAGILVNVTVYVLGGALVAIAVIAIARRPEQFYLRRLWPELAAANAERTRTEYSR
jgi:hypothetical protein